MKKYIIFLFVFSLIAFVGSVTYFSQARITNPSGVITLTTGGAPTAGSIIFSDGTLYAQDNANLFWNDSTNRLGIGTTSPARVLSVEGDSILTGSLKVGPITGTSTLIIRGTGNSSIEGLLGIGTTTPARVFSVEGNSILTGSMKVGPLTGTSTLVIQGTGISSIAGSLGIASTSPFSEFGVESSSGTTTATVGSGTKPSCLQLYTSGGTAYKVFLSNVDGTVTSQAGSCE